METPFGRRKSYSGTYRKPDLIFICRGYDAYDRLSPSFAKYVESLDALHEARFFQYVAEALGNKLRTGERGSPGNVGDDLEAVHPIVRLESHPIVYSSQNYNI